MENIIIFKVLEKFSNYFQSSVIKLRKESHRPSIRLMALETGQQQYKCLIKSDLEKALLSTRHLKEPRQPPHLGHK